MHASSHIMKLGMVGKSSTPKPPIRVIVMSAWKMDEGSCRQDYSIRRTTRCECAAHWKLLLIPSFFFPFFLFYLFPPLSAPSSPVESEERMGSIGGGAEDCRASAPETSRELETICSFWSWSETFSPIQPSGGRARGKPGADEGD